VAFPFSIRRLWLLIRGALVDRDNPRFGHLTSIDDPEGFVWAILPHAARSFAPSILLLPEDQAKASAVAYLYARMLDTYEDLSANPSAARDALSGFASRFDTPTPRKAPVAPRPLDPDNRDRTHMLLVERHELVDEVFLELDPAIRRRIVRLVEDMAVGMSEFSAVFERQGGVLESEKQVLEYCRQVIGLPALFVMDLVLDGLSDEQTRDALEVSELIQLANITRDIEKDLKMGVAYHPSLKPHLGSYGDDVAAAAILSARRDLMVLAVQRVPSFRRLVAGVKLPRLSIARSAAVMMMLFTDRHYAGCARDIGAPTSSAPPRVATMVMESLPAAFSSRWAERILLRVEKDLLATV
jgi:phytoene/squalene synthetase